VVIGGGLGVLYGIDPVSFMQHASDVANNQIAQAGFFFMLAAFIHAGRVKAEIKNAFVSLTGSIDALGATLSNQLEDHANKLSDHEKKLASLASQVSQLGPLITTVKQGE
jgi:hypothetical protein